MRLLIVEDNSQMRRLLRRILTGLFTESRECADGAEALDAYTEFQPDWVLMDWEMKQVNGLVATRQIIADFPDAKVLLVTNHDEKDLRQAAREAGACGYVLKENLLDVRGWLQTPAA